MQILHSLGQGPAPRRHRYLWSPFHENNAPMEKKLNIHCRYKTLMRIVVISLGCADTSEPFGTETDVLGTEKKVSAPREFAV